LNDYLAAGEILQIMFEIGFLRRIDLDKIMGAVIETAFKNLSSEFVQGLVTRFVSGNGKRRLNRTFG